MDEQVKICPGCCAEYYAHITECRSCDMALVTAEQWSKMQNASRGEGALVCIEAGDLDRINALCESLGALGIEAQVLSAPESGGGCSGGCAPTFGLYVPQSVAHAAAQKVEEIWHRMNPEIKEAAARLDAGLCPACGSEFSHSDAECPDCGLYLGDAGDGPGSGHNNCGPGCP